MMPSPTIEEIVEATTRAFRRGRAQRYRNHSLLDLVEPPLDAVRDASGTWVVCFPEEDE